MARDAIKQQQQKVEESPSKSKSLKSGEVRVAEELASDWLVDKKVVRFNLNKNEEFNHTQQTVAAAAESSVLPQ